MLRLRFPGGNQMEPISAMADDKDSDETRSSVVRGSSLDVHMCAQHAQTQYGNMWPGCGLRPLLLSAQSVDTVPACLV